MSEETSFIFFNSAKSIYLSNFLVISVVDKSCLLLKVKCVFFVTFYIFCSYYFSVFKLDDFKKAQHAIYMFKDLFGLSKFDTDSLIRFTLTVRKNYRRVPYHNWAHGFSVANSMYTVIKRSQDTFQANEVSINNMYNMRPLWC